MSIIRTKHTPDIIAKLLIIGLGCVFLNATVLSFNVLNFLAESKFFWFNISQSVIMIIVAVLIYLRRIDITLNRYDFLIILSLLYVLIRNYFLSGIYLDEKIMELVTLSFFYLIVRVMMQNHLLIGLDENFTLLVLLFSIPVLTQVVIGYLQLTHTLAPFKYPFSFTGFFTNPALFSIYIGSASCFLLSFVIYKKTYRYLLIILLLFLIFLLIYSQSRASILALICGISSLIMVKLKLRELFSSRRNKLLVFLLFSLAIGFFYFLYSIKKQSADGRLLIWSVSFDIIKDSPFFGVGYGRFGKEYNLYQGIYFDNNSDKILTLGKLADDTKYAFNEFIGIAVERGVFGLLLFIAPLVLIFSANEKYIKCENLICENNSKIIFFGAKSGLIFIVVSSLFSYPFSSLPICILYFFFIAILSSYSISKSTKPLTILSFFLLIIGIFIWSYTAKRYTALKIWNSIETSKENKSSKNYESLLPLLGNMYSFRSQYAKSLANEGKIQLAIQQFEISKQNTTTKEIFFQLGKLYKKIHQNKAAETQYLILVRMFPELIEPKYMLAVIYYENRELGRLKNISDFMKDFNPKIDSDIGDQMKAEINDMYLQLLKSTSNK